MLSCEIIGFLGSDAKKTEKGCSCLSLEKVDSQSQ